MDRLANGNFPWSFFKTATSIFKTCFVCLAKNETGFRRIEHTADSEKLCGTRPTYKELHHANASRNYSSATLTKYDMAY